MAKGFNLSDYNTVAERMTEFFEKYPEGSFQSECQFTQVNDRWVAIVKAAAYRNPDDPRPGHGLAYEFIPGATQFTKDSELQNAETAAWGRAVMAIGAADSRKGIASREEVRNRSATPDNVIDNLEGRQALRLLCEQMGWDPKMIAALFQARFDKEAKSAPNDEIVSFVNMIKTGVINVEAEPQPA